MARMTTAEAYKQVYSQQPPVVYLTGKTCTGKTTFSNQLRSSCDYDVIELDEVVYDAVITPFDLESRQGEVFVSVYKTMDNPQWLELFVTATQTRIRDLLAQNKNIIVDGAIAKSEIIRNVFDDLPDVTIVYFHPGKSSATYVRNLTSRFKDTTAHNRNGLPDAFWRYIDKGSFARFCQDRVITPQLEHSISAYAEHSWQESAKRLEVMQKDLPSIMVVEV